VSTLNAFFITSTPNRRKTPLSKTCSRFSQRDVRQHTLRLALDPTLLGPRIHLP
jgi:hypothetical protein